MKIQFFEKSLDMIKKRFKLQKTTKEDIVVSYFVTTKEAFANTTYYYVRTKDGKEALYLYPNYKFIEGEDFLSKKTLKSLPKKQYKTTKEHIRNEVTEGFFYRLKTKHKSNKLNEYANHIYTNGFSYLTSLYYEEDERYKEAYNKLYQDVKNECDRLGIKYETNPDIIMEKKLDEAFEEDEFKSIDVRVCKSKESIDNYIAANIVNQTDGKILSHKISNLQYTKTAYVLDYNGNFLNNSDKLIDALLDPNYPNREEILKNYMEFFISKDQSFEIIKYLEEAISKADEMKFLLDQNRYNKNVRFIMDLEEMIKHNPEEETYRYHATTDLEAASNILEEGFYSYSESLDSTSFCEFNMNQILSYSYGNGFEQFGDFIVVISEPKNEDIVEELTEEEQSLINIMPRRNAIVANKPTHKVDKKHIVGFIDKKHEKVIVNPEYVNNEKKQINM